MVTGTLHVFRYSVYVLFDSGASHSFIAADFVRQATLKTEPLGYDLNVSTPIGRSLIVNQVVYTEQLSISGFDTQAMLIVMPLIDYDVILGMDWLSANRATIDCERKKVEFLGPDGDPACF